MAIELAYQQLLASGERCACALDHAALRAVLERELPDFKVGGAPIALFDGADRETLKPLLFLCEGEPRPLPAAAIPAGQILSVGDLFGDRRHTVFVLPLTFEAECLGVAVFQVGSGLTVCGMLREQISVSVKNIALRTEIAEQTQLHERTIQERRAVTERMKSLSILAGGVAHDLNSALGPLLVLPDLILRELNSLARNGRAEAERLRSHVETIRAAGTRSTEILRDLMTLGRLGQTEKTPVDVNRVVANCLTGGPLLHLQREGKQVEVALELHPGPLTVLASRHHLERATSNLIRNAAEAIGDEGLITVGSARRRLRDAHRGYEAVAPGEYAVITETDNGNGIPPEVLSRIFDPFYTSKQLRGGSGTGLGLSIVQGIVKEHDGYIDVRSVLGQGTTFDLYFPCADAP